MWPMTTHQAFTKLKLQIAKVPTLHLPNFSQPFVLETDASSVAVGAVLNQKTTHFHFSARRYIHDSKRHTCM